MEEPGARRSWEELGGARRSQEEPGGASRCQEEPGKARRTQDEPGGIWNLEFEHWDPSVTSQTKKAILASKDPSWPDLEVCFENSRVHLSRSAQGQHRAGLKPAEPQG